MPGKYDTEAKAKEMAPETVAVGSRTFKVKRTGSAMKKVMAIDTGEEGAPDESDKAVEVLYDSISYLIVDEEGVNPDPRWLEDNLDFEVAADLMETLMPGSGQVPPPVALVAPSEPPSTPASEDQG